MFSAVCRNWCKCIYTTTRWDN